MKIKEMNILWKRGRLLACLCLVFCIYISLGSCVLPKNITYFNNLKRDTLHPGEIVIKDATPFKDPKIEPNDILSITIQTLAQNEGNAPVQSNSSASPTMLSGSLVDKNGYVEVSLIGFVKVGGLTTTEAREKIKQMADAFYNQPVVTVRLVNFEVTVLGDVVRPGPVNIPSEKATIIDVIGLAGDLNMTARRKNILLARTENGQTKFVRLDLTSTDLYRSPYLYVKQRDVIYVEQNNFKKQSSDNTFTRFVTYSSGIVGILSILYLTGIVR